MNLIKQIVRDGEYGTQTIKIVVRSNERGAQGEPGPQGTAATIQAGKAYSIPGGQQPAVINTGSSSNAVFDFYIPRNITSWGDIIGNIAAQEDLNNYLEKVDTAIQPDDINYEVMQDLSVSSNGSTSVLQLDADKVNLKTGATSTKNIPLTVASSTKAGVMNSATFDAVKANSSNIQMILGGMVAVNGLPSAPTQAELTTAWEQASGFDTPSNYAKILDIDNSKYWTYYTNLSSWYASSADIQVDVSTFTNSSEGLIMGSTTPGQVYAESNGTGSVNGWDTLSANVADNTANKLASNNLSASNGLVATATGSGANTAIDIALANKAVNTKIWTAKNLSPATDDLAGWQALLGTDRAVYWTQYDLAGSFTNQPNRYGFLETVITSSEIYQRWHSQAGGNDYYRSGNASGGWWGASGSTGEFRRVLDSHQYTTRRYEDLSVTTNSVGPAGKWLNPTYTIPADGLYFVNAKAWTGGTTTKHQLVSELYVDDEQVDKNTSESVTDPNGAAWARTGDYMIMYLKSGSRIRLRGTINGATLTAHVSFRIKKIF